VVSTASNRSTQKRAISDTDEHNKTQLKKKKAAESEEDGMRRNQQHKTQSRRARGVVREGEGRERGAEKERGAERAKMPGKS
jgi:hypothetical protein